MKKFFFKLYAKIFARPSLYKVNFLMLRLSLRGLGVLNYFNNCVDGEKNFITSFLPKRLPVRPIIFDVGANIGNYSAAISERFPNALIHTFEPHPKNFQILSKREYKAEMYFNNVALSTEKGSVELFDYKEQDGSAHASLYREVIEEIHGQKMVSHVVRQDCIDAYISANNISRIDLLKIDVEGNELKVIEGAKEAIEQNKIAIIHFEFNEMNVESRIYMLDFYRFLKNYSFYRMLPHHLLPLGKYSPVTHEIFAYQNIVAINKSNNIIH